MRLSWAPFRRRARIASAGAAGLGQEVAPALAVAPDMGGQELGPDWPTVRLVRGVGMVEADEDVVAAVGPRLAAVRGGSRDDRPRERPRAAIAESTTMQDHGERSVMSRMDRPDDDDGIHQ
jgi:hypothetical protein